MKNNDLLEKWKIIKLIHFLEEGNFGKLPHQRPLSFKQNSPKRFIESTLNGKLTQNFIFADLQSSYDCSEKQEDKEILGGYLKRGIIYSIEDCQHRITSLQSITSDCFINEFAGKMDTFLNCEVPVLILKDRTIEELINCFGEVNSGITVTNKDLLWGIDNNFNKYIKKKFVEDHKLLQLYKTKNNSEKLKRIIYGNVIKIIKVCLSNDNIINSNETNAKSMMMFVKSNMNVEHFNNIMDLFELWYVMIKNHPTKDSFATQSNLFFILHILNNTNEELSQNKVNFILSKLTDTRSSPEKRYNNILNLIKYG
jgi:hypothetical protein